ncbi:hypothetical protein MMC34_002099 [Xylographa carneopallida]|nr:hypothetical protein [Xylographa carneopallida]
MVELRKRKAPAEAAPAPPTKKSVGTAAASKTKDSGADKKSAVANGLSSKTAVAAGNTITLDGFGGEIETNDGEKTTLKKLVEKSKAGVVLFTYPKASTPGCTTQACLFRDQFTPLTSTGFSIYGLSRDSPKSNTTFKTKQNLPYTLLCDPSASLIGAIGLKKAPSGTTRGVFVIDKEGKVLAAEPGGPAATVEVVSKLISEGGDAVDADATEKVDDAAEGSKEEQKIEEGKPVSETAEPATKTNGTAEEKKEDVAQAEVAADVADSAKIIDDIPPV